MVMWLHGVAFSMWSRGEGRRRRDGNSARQVLSVMTHHLVPGGPHSGRDESVTITVINGEEAF